LIEYAEGLLAGPARGEVERHIADCKECAARVALIRANVGAFKTIETVTAPDHLWRGISQKIAEINQPSGFVLWIEDLIGSMRRHAVPAVSFALIIVASALLLSKGDLFKKSAVTFVDVHDDAAQEISVYIGEHTFSDNSALYRNEMADLRRALEEGI
jgi:anti-sigma factor RsiW